MKNSVSQPTTPPASAASPAVRALLGEFQIAGELRLVEPFGSGHINDTFRVTCGPGGGPSRYILQRINPQVFHNPGALMENFQRVTAHLARQLAGQPEADRRVLTLVPTHAGRPYQRDAAGHDWRVFHFIERARTVDVVESPAQAFQVARAFGRFQALLADLPAPRLHDTIPDFHHTPKRLAALEKTVAADVCQRAAAAGPEIEFARRHRAIAGALLEAGLPERVTHNDTKINNVMLDDATGEGICVIDLDTVMPGLALYDFGDLVRSTTSSAAEDEGDLIKVQMQFPLFAALLRGYLSGAAEFLTAAEKRLLPVAGQVITFELGLRFLTDFLAGDPYFKVAHAGQNLERCRMQFKLFESIARQEPAMRQLVGKI